MNEQETSDFDLGYAQQTLWLHGKALVGGGDRDDRYPLTLTDARRALESRRATIPGTSYNRGGTQATADYVARLERGAASQRGTA